MSLPGNLNSVLAAAMNGWLGLDPASQALIESEDTYPVFAHRTRWGYTVDRSSLGRGTAFHRDWLLEIVGFRRAVIEGTWGYAE